ncbi:sensor histidine kinase [Weissella confusa]|uniref:sensor histidine kinase n=1 Tax=Weissella confusa TaxID=1583 RepID=UPI0022E2E1B0|nr:histidine kinase [Weissella confusa]
MEFKQIRMWPIVVWLIVLGLSSGYINMLPGKSHNYFISYVALQFVITFMLYGIRMKNYRVYLLLISEGMMFLIWTAGSANVIYILGLLPIVFVDLWLRRQENVYATWLVISILAGIGFYFLTTNYSLVNVMVIFDAIILFTALLFYFTRLTGKIIESEKQNRFLVKQMESVYSQMENMVSMRERERYAQNLHDSVTQDLIAIKLKLELLDRRFDATLATQQSITDLLDFTQRSVEKARQQISDMKTDGTNTNYHSVDIISDIVARFELEYQISINSAIEDVILSNHLGVNLSSILNELLTNVVRHAYSQNAVVLFKKSDYGYDLSVIDFGVGMAASIEKDGHYGLQGVSDRVKGLNGLITINSDANEGTTVNISLPKGGFE